MKLTDPEIIEARRRALENNPRSYEPWYEVLTFGREVEKMVLVKYWNHFPNRRPVEDGWYVVVVRPFDVRVKTLFWSNGKQFFSEDGIVKYENPVLAFKKMEEFVEEAGLNPPSDEEGSLAHQGVRMEAKE